MERDSAAGPRGAGIPDTVLVLRVGELRIGIDVRHVREVTRPLPIAVPLHDSRGLRGLVTLRGRPTAALDLGELLGIAAPAAESRTRLVAIGRDGNTACLLVDDVFGLEDVRADTIAPCPATRDDGSVVRLDHVVRTTGGTLVGLLAIATVLDEIAATAGDVA